MTTTDHRRTGRIAGLAAGLLVSLTLLAACGDTSSDTGSDPGSDTGDDRTGTSVTAAPTSIEDGGEPADPTSDVPRPDADFQADVTVGADAVRIRYTLTNHTGAELVVPEQPTDGDAYVTGDVTGDGDGIVVSRRVFAQPDTDVMDWAQAPKITGTRVADGDTLRGTLEVALPFERLQPYGDDLGYGPIALPDPAAEVRFCLGVLPSPYPAQVAEQRAAHPTIDHGLGNASGQYLFCSEPVRLTGGSSS